MTERRDPWVALLDATQGVEAYGGEADGWRRLFEAGRPGAQVPEQLEAPEEVFRREQEWLRVESEE